MWGVSLEQLQELLKDSRFSPGMSTRSVVEQIIKPDTAGRNLGFAVLKNYEQPLTARMLVSHAWDDSFADLVSALTPLKDQGPFWLAATAMYQPEDNPNLTIERQLGAEAGGPLVAVLSQATCLLCVLTETGNIFSRLWCIFEIYTALELGLEVRMISKQRGVGLSTAIDQVLIESCFEPISCKSACCGVPGQPHGEADQTAIRAAIEALPGGYDALDRAVDEVRFRALKEACERLLGGGWKDTEIGRRCSEAISVAASRLGPAFAPMRSSPELQPRVSTSGIRSSTIVDVPSSPLLSLQLSRQAAEQRTVNQSPTLRWPASKASGASTPRSAIRQHWAPTTSV